MSRIRLHEVFLLRTLVPPRRAQIAVAAVLLVRLTVAATRAVTDPDVFWIAAAGRWMIEHRAIVAANTFSFVDPDRPWIMHEWLYGPLHAWGLTALGPAFFALVATLSAAGVAAIVVDATLGRARDPFLGALACLVALVFFSGRFGSPRPSATTMVLTLATARLAFDDRAGGGFGPRHALAAVLVELVWVNAHGSFPLGLFLLAAGALEAARSGQPSRVRWIAAAFAFFATFVNPYGTRLHRMTLAYLVGDRSGPMSFIHETVEEFSPVWAAGSSVGPFEIAAALVLCACAVSATLSPAFRVRGIVGLALAASAAVHVRELQQFGLVASILLVPWVDATFARMPPSSRDESRGSRPALTARVVGAPLAVAFVAHLGLRAARDPVEWIGPSLGGGAVARLATTLPDGARVFAPFSSAGLVLWMAPRVGVLYDSRNDCYARDVAEDAAALERTNLPPEVARAIVERRGLTAVLTRRTGALAHVLVEDLGWRAAARDDAWTVLLP